MQASKKSPKPAVGARYRFKVGASQSFADVPVRVVYVWPRFRSGDYLVTLEFDRPRRPGVEDSEQFEAFVSELEPVDGSCREREASGSVGQGRPRFPLARLYTRRRLRQA